MVITLSLFLIIAIIAGVYVAARQKRLLLGRLALVIASLPVAIIEAISVHHFAMASISDGDDIRYMFADMGLAIATVFSLMWVGVVWVSFTLGREAGRPED